MKKVIDKTVNLDLVGVNGNAFMIMGVFKRQAKHEGWSQEEIDLVLDEAKSSCSICSQEAGYVMACRFSEPINHSTRMLRSVQCFDSLNHNISVP